MISPSMMCASIYGIEDTLQTFEKEKIEYLHIDIMDGVFVPNLMLCEGIAKQYRTHCSIPLDYHLMIVNPEQKISWFQLKEGDLLSFHLEACENPRLAIAMIHEKKAKAGIAICPETPFEEVIPYLDDLDFLVIMTVHPGFAGQKLVESTLEKIREARNYLDEHGFYNLWIEVDGNVSFTNAKLMKEQGANLFVAGTSSVFHKDHSLAERIAKLREAIQ